MKKINWCKKQKKGIKLIEPNDNLSEEYYQNSEESLKVLRFIKKTKSNMWLATTKYYIEYFAVYSILMKIGIKCEIHDCTISLVRFLEKEGLIKIKISDILEKDKKLRMDNQYYLKNRPVKIDFEKLSEFIVFIKDILDNLNKKKIEELRTKIKKF
ncbi:MAG: hypothetical protein KKA79_07905 [Nanoarchaeota archaeon]|nr:hypothetical protein [Nanoarchaeota archaeon]MCG2717680.1 hypothetical protein [Nanoarchaeota archaeon]